MRIHPVLWFHEKGSSFAVAIWIAICGLSMGWLVGMSMSPTVQTVLSSLLTVLIAAIAILVGVTPESKGEKAPEVVEGATVVAAVVLTKADGTSFPVKVTLAPLAILCLAVALGATVGGFARNNGLIGPAPELLSKRWAGTGLKSEDLQKRFLDLYYSNQASKPDDKSASSEKDKKTPPVILASPNLGFGLFATPGADACDRLVGLQGEVLKKQIEVAVPGFVFPGSCTSDACVAAAKEVLCPSIK